MMPNIYTDTTPYNITVPANLKMLAPIPNTNPSFLYSSAALVIEWAKPVMGIIKALFKTLTQTSKTPKAVKIEDIAINVSITKIPDSFLGKSNQTE